MWLFKIAVSLRYKKNSYLKILRTEDECKFCVVLHLKTYCVKRENNVANLRWAQKRMDRILNVIFICSILLT